jgi:hypothetical protein
MKVSIAFVFQILLVLLHSLHTMREKVMNCNKYDELYTMNMLKIYRL